MRLTQSQQDDLSMASSLAPNMRGFVVREDDPVIETSHAGEVVVTLPRASTDLMDLWVRACSMLTRNEVTTNTREGTITFRP